jgi:hypothetical protein
MTVEAKSATLTTKRTYQDSQDGDSILPDIVVTTNWTDVHSGASNPGYRKQISAGVNATTPYFVDTRRVSNVRMSADSTVTRYNGSTIKVRWEQSGYLGPAGYDPLDSSTTLADITARQQFVARYRSRRTQFQAGVFLGELRETVEMIRNPAKALRDGIDSYYGAVKKRLRKSKNRRRTIQDTWLEYSFGWAPLVNDVADACKLATADPFRVFEKITSKGIDNDRSETYTASDGYATTQVNYQVSKKSQVIVRYKGAIRAQNQPPGFPEQLGLSWSNVLPTAWELIPYSFLVDYFTNVGAVIDGISTGTIGLAWGCRSQVQNATVEVGGCALDYDHLALFTTIPGWTASGFANGGGKCSSRYIYNRSVIDSVSVGIGDAMFKLPGSNIKWLNIAALARLRQ